MKYDPLIRTHWLLVIHSKIFMSVSEKCADNFEETLSEMRKFAEEKVKTVVQQHLFVVSLFVFAMFLYSI